MSTTQYKARVWELVTVTGTGTINLSGTAQTGCQTFTTACTTGDKVAYLIYDTVAFAWETGIGTFTSGSPSTLTRGVLESSNSNSIVTFGGNLCNVTLTMPSPVQVSAGSASQGLIPCLGPTGVLDPSMNLAGATLQTTSITPTAPNSASAYTMQGLGSATSPAVITPVKTGKLDVCINGTIIAVAGTSATYGIQYQLSYGTGTAPGSNTTLAGTQFGSVQKYEHGVAITVADTFRPFSISGIISGLAIGTAVWLDLAAEAVTTASEVGLSNVTVSAAELS